MSTTGIQPVPTRGRHANTIGSVIRSEWTKFWSVRSTPWSLIILVVVTWGFSVLLSWATAANLAQRPEQQRLAFDSTSTSLSGISFGQLSCQMTQTYGRLVGKWTAPGCPWCNPF